MYFSENPPLHEFDIASFSAMEPVSNLSIAPGYNAVLSILNSDILLTALALFVIKIFCSQLLRCL
jgi:hypothetical protein